MMISRGQRVLYGPVEEVRRSRATGSVLVRATGDLSRVEGVERITEHNGRFELLPRVGISSQELLRRLATAPELVVEEFEIALPSLDDIFVQVVQEKQAP